MENVPIWHYRSPNKEEYQQGLKELAEATAMRNRFAERSTNSARPIRGFASWSPTFRRPAASPNFGANFPHRFINIGVAEQIMIGMCAGHGAARAASRSPTRSRPSRFIGRSRWCATISAIRILPVTVVGIGGGVTYSTLGAHAPRPGRRRHRQRHSRICQIIAPCDPAEDRGGDALVRGAEGRARSICGSARPASRISPKRRRTRGCSANCAISRGGDVCILSYGPIMKRANAARRSIRGGGQERRRSFRCHTLKPLDREGAGRSTAAPIAHVVVIEECAPNGGFAHARQADRLGRRGALPARHVHAARMLSSIITAATTIFSMRMGWSVREVAARLGLQ